MKTDIVTLHNADPDAAEIGSLYAQARGSMVEAMRFAVACGASLIRKKQSLAHGQWLPWLEVNADVLGFKDRTANLLMKAASNPQLTADLMRNVVDDATALAISRKIWGNATSQPKAPKCEQTGDVSLSDTRTDTKGRHQPAHKPPKAAPRALDPGQDSVAEDDTASVISQCVVDISERIELALDEIARNDWFELRQRLHCAIDVPIDQRHLAVMRARQPPDERATEPETKPPSLAEPPPEMVECPKCHGTGNMDDDGIPEFLRRQPS